MTLLIRDSGPADCALILDLIRELSVYEKLEHEVDATEALIEQALFADNPRAFCDIAEWDGATAGFAIWFYTFNTFRGKRGVYLEDLFVRSHFRGRGVGKALLARLARRCLDQGLSRLQWSVLDWNQPAINVYDHLGAVADRQWIPYLLSGEALERLARADVTS